MKKTSLLLVIALLLSFAPSVAWADASPWTEGKTYQEKMFGKLDFGIKNVVLGPMHVISDPLHGISKEGTLGAFKGLGEGLYHGLSYTVGGALHAVTFPITNLDVPLPDGGVKCPFDKK